MKKDRLSSISCYFKDMTKPNHVDWLLTIAIILFCYVSFNHGDITATATHGKDLLECIFLGKFFEFYDYTQSTAVYPIAIYLVFAVWSIPVFIAYRIIGIPLWGVLSYSDIPYLVLMWYKLLPTIFYIGTAYLLYRIVLEIKLDKNTAKWISFLFISAPVGIFSQFVFGQYDSLGLFFTVWALYMFIKKRYYAFSVLCAVAITFKMFAFFFFVPLILLVEKRVLHIIKYCIIAFSGYLLCTLLFVNSQGNSDAMKFSGNILPRLFLHGIDTLMGTISLFTLSMMAICVMAYNKEVKDEREYIAYSIYLPFFSYGTLFCFILWHPQWVLLLMPFMSLAMLLSDKPNSSYILHTAMAVGYYGALSVHFSNNVDANMLSFGLFAQILGERTPQVSLSTVFTVFGFLSENLYYSLFAGSILILLYRCFPKMYVSREISYVERGNRGYILLRPLSILIYVIPALYIYLFHSA